MRKPWLYARDFREILLGFGPYDAVHSHVHHYSGFVLRLAHQSSVPIRIAHSHNDTSPADMNAHTLQRMYMHLSRFWIHRHASQKLAVSETAAKSLFGSGWIEDPRTQLLYYGIDIDPFEQNVDRRALRDQLGIPPYAFVIGHVGRFFEQKNHKFLLEVACKLLKQDSQIYLLLVGDGPLRSEIESQIRSLGLTERVVIAGVRSDIPKILLGGMDMFVFPSLYEGLPMAVMEAQAAALPTVLSDAITPEVDIVKPLINRMPLSASPEEWAHTILTLKRRTHRLTPLDAVSIFKQSHINIEISTERLLHEYQHV